MGGNPVNRSNRKSNPNANSNHNRLTLTLILTVIFKCSVIMIDSMKRKSYFMG